MILGNVEVHPGNLELMAEERGRGTAEFGKEAGSGEAWHKNGPGPKNRKRDGLRLNVELCLCNDLLGHVAETTAAGGACAGSWGPHQCRSPKKQQAPERARSRASPKAQADFESATYAHVTIQLTE